jgi:hypothetical protein
VHRAGNSTPRVGVETRKVLLGHTIGNITTHYSAVELAELINAVNKIDRSPATPAITLLRVATLKHTPEKSRAAKNKAGKNRP